MWCVYLLRCSNSSLYCGITNDLDRRINAHNLGKGAKYTRAFRPVTLAMAVTAKTKSQALKAESAIKRLSKEKKELLVSSDFARQTFFDGLAAYIGDFSHNE